MKLLMVSHTANLWTQHYARFFVERGDELLTVSMTPDPVAAGQMEFIGVEPYDRRRNKHLFVTRVPRLRGILKRFRPDVVFAPYVSSNGLLAALAWRGPLVVSGMGSDVLIGARGAGVSPFFRRKIVQYVCGRAQAIHVVARNIERALHEFGVPAEKVHVFPLGIDTRRFHPSDEAPVRVPRLICTRKHEPIYDIPCVLRALRLLKDQQIDFHCTFVGGGSLLEEHRRLAGELGLAECVNLVGNVPHADLPGYLRAADIYVSASHSDGTSSSLLEAMATGLLPVVSDIEANTPWICDGVSGLLFKVGDPTSLASALERAVASPDLRRVAVSGNRQLVLREGDEGTNNERLATLLQRAIASSRESGLPVRSAS